MNDRLNQLKQYMDFYRNEGLGRNIGSTGPRQFAPPGSADYPQESQNADGMAAIWANQMMGSEQPQHTAPNFFGGQSQGFQPQTYVQPQRNQLAQFFGASRGK